MRDEKLKVLRALRPIAGDEVATKTVRGQYRAGAINGELVPGYLEEIGAASSAHRDLRRAQGRDRQLALGGRAVLPAHRQAPAARASEIVIQFRAMPHSIFQPDAGRIVPNRLVVRLQPDEGMKLYLMTKDPGPGGMRLREAPLDLSFAETFKVRYPDAYERLLMDVVRGNPTLFMRRDEVEAAWAGSSRSSTPGRARRRAQALHGRHLGPVRRDRADRARRPHLARGRRVNRPHCARCELRSPFVPEPHSWTRAEAATRS